VAGCPVFGTCRQRVRTFGSQESSKPQQSTQTSNPSEVGKRPASTVCVSVCLSVTTVLCVCGAAETQACADAASDRIGALEEAAEATAAEHEAALQAAAAALQAAQAEGQDALAAAQAQGQASLDASLLELEAAQVSCIGRQAIQHTRAHSSVCVRVGVIAWCPIFPARCR
jgi:hypothetical protein